MTASIDAVQSRRRLRLQTRPGELAHVVRHLQSDHIPIELLVGPDTGDDAAVWKIDDHQAHRVHRRLHHAGGRRCAHLGSGRRGEQCVRRLRDGRPAPLRPQPRRLEQRRTARPSCCPRCWPAVRTSPTAGGFAIVGGHTIDDPEPKYGMSVTGMVHPDRILTQRGPASGPRHHLDQAARCRGV